MATDPGMSPAYPNPDRPGGGGRRDWQDGGAPHETGATNPDSATRKPPSRPGRANGQVVRTPDGGVYQWNRDNHKWSFLRIADNRDKQNIPPAAVALDKNYKGNWKPSTTTSTAPHEDGSADADSAMKDRKQPGGQGGGGKDTTAAGKNPKPVKDPAAATDPGTSGSIPGGHKLWKIGDNHFLIYMVPGTKPPVPMAWKVRDNDLESVLGSGKHKPDRVFKDWKEARRKRGVLGFGSTDELNNTSEHPFDVFKNDYEKEAQIQPWLRDPEVLAVHAMAILEGRELKPSEWLTTKWFRSRSDEEIAMATLAAEKPEEFRDQRRTALRNVETWLREAGFDFSGNKGKVVGYLARQYMTGKMDENDLKVEIERLSNPYDPNADPTAGFDKLPAGAKAVRHKGRTYVRIGDKDYKLAKGFETAKFGTNPEVVNDVKVAGVFRNYLNRKGTPQGRDSVEGLEELRGLVEQEIGPALASQFSESDIARWAQKIKGNEAEKNLLMDKLRGIRKAAWGDTYDESLSYAEIAVPARNLVQQIWGQKMDEKDPLFQKILKMNDQMQGAHLLRQEGMKRGNRAVMADWSQGAMQALGDGVMPVLGG